MTPNNPYLESAIRRIHTAALKELQSQRETPTPIGLAELMVDRLSPSEHDAAAIAGVANLIVEMGLEFESEARHG